MNRESSRKKSRQSQQSRKRGGTSSRDRRFIHRWPDQPPVEDKRVVGVSFIDVLFALVVGLILEPLRDFDTVTGPGRAHLVVAAVLTILSWIGYHNSHNRPKYLIRFPNLPLFQFMLDVGMVVVYWLTASTYEGTEPPHSPEPTAVPEAWLVTIAFVLYCAWDFIALRIRRAPKYALRPLDRLYRQRMTVTHLCFALSVLTLAATPGVVTRPSEISATSVYAIDGLLVLLLVGFRLGKEYVTPPDAMQPRKAGGND